MLPSLLLLLSAAPAQAPAGRIEFNRDVRPILSDKCFSCHGPDASHRKGGLRLDTEAGSREALVPGSPDDSSLVDRITRKGAGRMPPAKSGKVLTAAEVKVLTDWVRQGAAYQAHWAYLPVKRPALPPVKDAAWPRGPIDRFVLAGVEAAGRRPAPPADPITLLRRLHFDLTGLPPTPAEVDAFRADRSPGAYEKVVDRLLASPAFGERLAIYWLDLVRYADTVGYHGDQEHPIAPYRDYVLRAFNKNLPFDRFTVEQLAGDLLPGATIEQRIASGYNRLLQTTHEGGAQDGEYRVKYMADRIRNLGSVWLGTTLGCAECHNHKFDPVTQKDFYSLVAFFADVQELGAFKGPDRTPTRRPPEIDVLSQLDRLESERLDGLIRDLQGKADDASRAELKAAERRRQVIERRKERTMITVSAAPRTIRVLRRGDWMDTGGEVVQPAVPAAMGKLPVTRRATRLDLARWLTSPDHPLTARVFVNRLWYLTFGAGLSRNLEDLGAQGEWPTHPELLDWLAADFRADWDVKRAVRQIVTSSAYRQSSQETRDDPENRLFARQGRYRLPAEMIRDSALSASGLLVRHLGGVSARPYQPDGYYVYLNFPKRTYRHDAGTGQYRRGVYTHWQRQFLHPMLKAFDAPSREECTAQRPISNTPLQALTLLNDPSFVEAARVLAARVVREGGDSDEARARWAWRVVLSRPPQPREVAALVRLVRLSRAQYQEDRAAAEKLLRVGLAKVPDGADVVELAAWTAAARVLLNLDETITRS